jgi:hypothetical protein
VDDPGQRVGFGDDAGVGQDPDLASGQLPVGEGSDREAKPGRN